LSRPDPADQPDREASITRWFHRLRDGDSRAAEILWRRYFPRLVRLAQTRFDADRDAVYGADDAAQSVLAMLCRKASAETYAAVETRDDLWRLLVVATRRKMIDRARYRGAARRDAITAPLDDHAELLSPTPDAQTLALLQESYDDLLASLEDDRLREIAKMRVAGRDTDDIAEHFSVSPRTIQRKLQRIRDAWCDRV